MSYLTYKDIRLKFLWDILNIEQLHIKIAPNKHASIYVKALLKEDTDITQNNLENEVIELYSLADNKTIFAAEITQAAIIHENNVCFLEVKGLSGTSNLDLVKKSRSFQDTTITYEQMIDQIIHEEKNTDAIYTKGEKEKIQIPLIQYRETNWEYIKRMASHFESVVVPEVSSTRPRFWFGMPEGVKVQLEADVAYEIKKEMTLVKTPFLSYQVKSWQNFNIGDYLEFKGQERMIYKKSIDFKDDFLVFSYGLCPKDSYKTVKKYNTVISGMAIQGEVLQTNKEEVRVHLDIDEKQDVNKAYWYDYIPTTGNMMYCMPKVGTRVALYFPDDHEEHAKIHYCVRTNGSAPVMSDPSCRYLKTEHNKAWALLPQNIYFEAIQDPLTGQRMRLELPDGNGQDPLGGAGDGYQGIRCTSPKVVFIMAIDDIEITGKQRASLSTKEMLRIHNFGVENPTDGGYIIIEGDHKVNGKKVYFATVPDDSEPPCEPFNDEPQKGEFSMFSAGLKIVGGIAAAVAGIAVGVLLAPAIGPAALIVGGAIVGAGIGLAVAGVEEVSSGNNMSAKEVLIKVGIGAVTGALASIPGLSTPLTIALVVGSGWAGMGLETALLGEDYTVGDYLVNGALSIAFWGAGEGISKAVTKLGNAKVLKPRLNRTTGQIDDEIAQLDRKIAQKYETNGRISGTKVYNKYLKNLSDDELIALYEKYNIAYDPAHPNRSIHSLKRYIVNHREVLGATERDALKQNRQAVIDEFDEQADLSKNLTIKDEIERQSTTGPRKVIDGIVSYNDKLKHNPNVSLNVVAAGVGSIDSGIGAEYWLSQYALSLGSDDSNSAQDKLKTKNNGNAPTSNNQSQNQLPTLPGNNDPMWNNVYSEEAGVARNETAITKINLIKAFYGIQ